MDLLCKGCGSRLLAESFAGPPRDDFAEAQVELIAWRCGWRDGFCWFCRRDPA